MAKPFFTAKHVESMALLPDNLEIGRAYFVDDEQVIVIDHGRGPVIYGKSPGPQGTAGEPIPQLQDQIDTLAGANIVQSKVIWDINKRQIADNNARKSDLTLAQTQIEQTAQDRYSTLMERIASETAERHSDIADLDATMNLKFQEQADTFNSALNILARSIAELYPEHFAPEDSQNDPLDNETISTDAGTWTIQQTILKDGTIVLNLEAQELLIDTLKSGDTVDFDGYTWTVENITTEDGVTSITIKP